LWDTSFLLDEGGCFDEERSCDIENVLTGDEVKCSSAKHGAGKVAHETPALGDPSPVSQ
jgi:hypothetical protein